MWAVQEHEPLAVVAVLGEKEKVAPALAEGAMPVGGAGVWGINCLGGSVEEMEKVAPALAIGAVRAGGAGVRGITCLGGSVWGEREGSTSTS